MKSIVVRFVLALVPALVLAGVLYALLPPWRGAITEVALLLTGWLAVVAFVRTALLPHEPTESAFEHAVLPRVGATNRLESLATVERRVALADTAAVHVHYRLRPILREIAAARLARRGVALDGDAAPVVAAIGADLAELLRHDRPRPSDPFAPGLPPAQLRKFVERLEAL